MGYVNNDRQGMAAAHRPLIVHMGTHVPCTCGRKYGVLFWEWKRRATRAAHKLVIIVCKECDSTELEYCTRMSKGLLGRIRWELYQSGKARSEENIAQRLVELIKKAGHTHALRAQEDD